MRVVDLAAFLGLAVAPAAAPQRSSPANSLPRALAAFAAADANRDGKIGPDEARAIPLSAEVLAAHDQDKDGVWSRDEFLLYYRHELAAGGQPVGSDLEAEIARIQALKRVRVVEEAKRLCGDSSTRSCDAQSVEDRFEKALADLETRAADRRTTRDDYQRLRNLIILSGRAASAAGGSGSAPPSGAQPGMLQVLERIERRAAVGQYAKEDFESLRACAVPRSNTAPRPNEQGVAGDPGRAASNGTPPAAARSIVPTPVPTAPTPNAAPAAVPAATGPADARRRAAPTRPESKPEPKPAPKIEPPKPAPVPERPPVVPPPRGKPDQDKPDRSRP